MDYIKSILAVLATLYGTYILMRRAKSDKVVSQLNLRTSEEKEKTIKELAIAQKEVEDAQIRYNNSRREYDSISDDKSSTSEKL